MTLVFLTFRLTFMENLAGSPLLTRGKARFRRYEQATQEINPTF